MRIATPYSSRKSAALVLALAGACLFLARAGAIAQTLAPTPAELESRRIIEERSAAKRLHEAELERLRETAKAASEARAKLEGEAAALKQDRTRLNTVLIETTARIRATEERAAQAESRLRTLASSEDAIRKSLIARRGVIADVLAALQRLGRRPPPAVLVTPEDMLQSVRAAILLGAVVPEMRQEAETLGADLTELVRLSTVARQERERLAGELGTLSGERERLANLVAARQERIVETERSAGDERSRNDQLAQRVLNLRELIDGLDKDMSAANRAAEEARAALAAQTREVREKFAAAAFKDPSRLSPRISFAETRGLLPQPASGALVKGFGAPDNAGGTTRGAFFSTRKRAVVSAPTDGWVAFAGPFRSYGRVLILNAGGGYHILLAGLERIDVAIGQFVLIGEPLGMMGDTVATGASILGSVSDVVTNGDTADTLLYVEFRRDGVSVDPAPWWSKPPTPRSLGGSAQDEKVRG
jgi:murein hydrolase activator